MRAQRDDAPCHRGVRGNTIHTGDGESITRPPPAGKQHAMLLYHIGARSLAQTTAAFARHPAWRPA
jgi:hypothetical protein